MYIYMTQILVDHSVIVVRKDRQLPSLTVVPWHLSRKRRLARQVVARCRRPALPKITHQMKGKWVVKHPQIVAFLLGFPYFSDLFRYQVQICPNMSKSNFERTLNHKNKSTNSAKKLG